MGQGKELLKPVGLRLAVLLLHVFPTLGATDDGAQRNHEDVKEVCRMLGPRGSVSEAK